MSNNNNNDMQWFGVAVKDDGDIFVTKARRNEDAATKLAEQREGQRHFAIQAANAGEARRLAAEQMLGETVATQGEALGIESQEKSSLSEPSEAELAEMTSTDEVDLSSIGQAFRSQAGLKWFGAALVAGEEDQGPKGVISPVGHRTIEAAQSEADTLPGGHGNQFVVQARSAEEAQGVADSIAETGAIPDGPVFAAPREVRPRTTNLGTGEPVVADVYYVTGPGTVHVNAECSFARRYNTAEFRPEDPATPVVANIKDGTTIDIGNGRKARDWCRFCAVDRGRTAMPAADEAPPAESADLETVEA